MSRSRALNRFNRFTAKRRRRNLRSEVPSFREDPLKSVNSFDHSDQLIEQAVLKEALLDFAEPQTTG